jgi:hypothetical protein
MLETQESQDGARRTSSKRRPASGWAGHLGILAVYPITVLLVCCTKVAGMTRVRQPDFQAESAQCRRLADGLPGETVSRKLLPMAACQRSVDALFQTVVPQQIRDDDIFGYHHAAFAAINLSAGLLNGNRPAPDNQERP